MMRSVLGALALVFALPLVVYVFWHGLSVVLSVLNHGQRSAEIADVRMCGAVAMLYVTCDDFDPEACETLLEQVYVDGTLFILDDSTEEVIRDRIDQWVGSRPEAVRILRRAERIGYKAGNIDHWLKQIGADNTYPYVLIADADERIPRDFTIRLAQYLVGERAFVQGSHTGTARLETTFQRILSAQVDCEWMYQVPARSWTGVPPMLGHGVLVRTDYLRRVGGFPCLTSEDLALTILFAARGYTGVLASDVVAREEFPRNYNAYWRRRRRWIEADAELARKWLSKLWRKTSVSWLAGLDMSLRELRLPFGSGYWLLLAGMSFGLLAPLDSWRLPRWSWIVLLAFLIPSLPVFRISRLSMMEQFRYVLVMTFVGATTAALHPIGVAQGIFGNRSFPPTGSGQSGAFPRSPWVLVWEMASGLLFVAGGVISHNWALIALGVAAGAAPGMRRRELTLLVSGTIVFWLLIAVQMGIDMKRGYVAPAHLLALAGLAVTLI